MEHGFLKDDGLASPGIPSVKGFLPSLHLNLADGYHRMGKYVLARKHMTEGEAGLSALKEDGYGKMVRAGLDNLPQRLTAASPDHQLIPLL